MSLLLKLLFFIFTVLFISENPYKGFLDIASHSKCFPCSIFFDSIISDQLFYIILIYTMNLLNFTLFVETATQNFIEKRSLIFKVSNVFLIIFLSENILRKSNILINFFTKDLIERMVSIIDNKAILVSSN